MPYEVCVLRNGLCDVLQDGYHVQCTVTLLKGGRNNQKILVDTGSAWDTEWLKNALADHNLRCEDITYVIGTHGHSDHIGNLNLFTNATHIVCHDINKGNIYQQHSFGEAIPYMIDEDLTVESTPGHTAQDISVFVQSQNPNLGLVAVCGDAFECEADIEDPSLWKNQSQFPDMQQGTRAMIAKRADTIIPGHGPMFKSPKSMKEEPKSDSLMITSIEDDLP